MKKSIAFGMVGLAALGLAGNLSAAEKAPQKVVDLAGSELAKLGSDPVIVEAVKVENAKGKTLDQIKELDKKWQQAAGVVDYMQALMNNPCGKRLKEIQKSAPYYAELFVMDKLGANVCMSDKTSDYWQGDEPKFSESYKDGKGAVHIGEVKFDDSVQAYIVQVSVPVTEGGAVIGAMTIGIDVDKLK